MSEFTQNLAIIIGINQYQNGVNPLKTAKPDAEKLAEILANQHDYQVTLITDSEAEKDKLLTLLNYTLPQLNLDEGDRLLFYFAGHGIARQGEDDTPQGFLLPCDAKTDKIESLLPMAEVYNSLAKLNCRHLLVILDCCFAGAFKWATSTRKFVYCPEKITKAHYHRFTNFKAWQVLTSSASNQEALDFIDNRGNLNDTQHSPFAEGLFSALTGKADYNGDGVITTPELYLFLRDYVEKYSKDRQTPNFFPLQKHDRGEYLFFNPEKSLNLAETPELNPDNNPYRGLTAYDEQHSRFFFGRDKLINRLYETVVNSDSRLTTVVGISGSGKSSLVKAGLIPKLEADESQKWQLLGTKSEQDNNKIEPIRFGTNPYNTLAIAFNIIDSQAKITPENLQQWRENSSNNENPLVKSIQVWTQKHPDSKLILIIDQFEELITLAPTIMRENESKKLKWWQKLAFLLFPQSQSGKVGNATILSLSKGDKRGIKEGNLQKVEKKVPLTKEDLGGYKSSSTPNNQEISLTNLANDNPQENQSWLRIIDLLADILGKCPNFHLIITLRSDFVPRFGNSAFKPYWETSQFMVTPMVSNELREVVLNPATEMALYFEPPSLADTIVDEVSQMPGGLPLLSFTLSELYLNLYQRWQNGETDDRALTLSDYQKLGGVTGSLTRRANQEYDNLPDNAHRLTMERVMLRMVEIEGGEAVRTRVLASNLTYPDDEENNRVEKVLNSLVNTRLVVTGKDSETKERYFEPAHDFLVKGWDKLPIWIQQQQENLALQRLLTPASLAWQKSNLSNDLWNANSRLERLREINNSQNSWLNALETNFIRSSWQRRQFNHRVRLGIGTGVFVSLTALTISALIGQRNALIKQAIASQQSATVNLRSNQALEGMIDSLQAGQTLQHPLVQNPLFQMFNPISDIEKEIESTLQWAVYRVKENNRLRGHDSIVRSTISPNNQMIASGGEDGIINIWNLQGQLLASWQGDKQRVWNVNFSPDSQSLASAGEDGIIRLWDLQGKQIKQWKAHNGFIRYVNFSPNGKQIASVGKGGKNEDGMLYLWDIEGKLLKSWNADKRFAKTVAFHPHHNNILVTVGMEKNVKLWNIDSESKQPLTILKFPSWSAFFSPDGEYLVAAGDDGNIALWDDKYNLVKKWQADEQRIWNVSFNSNSNIIASSGEDGSVRLWNLQGKELMKLQGHIGPVRTVNFSQNSDQIISSGDDGTSRFWRLSNQQLAEWQIDQINIQNISFTDQNKHLVTLNNQKAIIWNLKGEKLKELSWLKNKVKRFSYTSDSEIIATFDNNNLITIWNLSKKKQIVNFSSQNQMTDIWLSPDGELLATSESDNQIVLINLNNQQMYLEINISIELINDLKFSLDNQLLAIASKNGTIQIWDINKREKLFNFADHIGEVYQINFSNDSQLLVSAGQDNTIRVWDLKQGIATSIFQVYEGQITVVKFTPDNQQIINGDRFGNLYVWNLQQSQPIAQWQGHFEEVRDIDVSNDGRLLATVGKENKLKLWQIESLDDLINKSCNLLGDFISGESVNPESPPSTDSIGGECQSK